MSKSRELILIASHNSKQFVKPLCKITFCDHVRNMKQVLCGYDRVNRPLGLNYLYLCFEAFFTV